MLLTLFIAITTAGSSVYMGDYWDRKGKVPLVSGYNEAVVSTKQMRGILALLGIFWGVSFLLEMFL
jgi:hypothetical protein